MQTRLAPNPMALNDFQEDATRAIVRQLLLHSEERERLYRFCRRLTGDGEVAEDLTQEALLEAWRQADTLQNPAVWRSWLHGIAKNMYLRWRRSHGREQQRRVNSNAETITALLESHPDDTADLYASLERAEVAQLVDRAMDILPERAREVLSLFYREELPHGEIAARLGLTESGAAVRLHRGKQVLRRTLTTDLRAESVALGLIPADTPEVPTGPETHLWCPFCGKVKLRLITSGERERFYCPRCEFVQGPRPMLYPSDCIFGHDDFDPAPVIGSVRGYKPAINRITAFWGRFLNEAREQGATRCLGCGQVLALLTHRPAHLKPRANAGFHTHCTRCRKIHVLQPSAFAFTTKEVQAFWKRHPRMRLTPSRPVPGTEAFVTTFESVNDCASIELVFHSQDYRILETTERSGR